MVWKGFPAFPAHLSMRPVPRRNSFLFLGAPKSLQMVIAAMKLKDAYSLDLEYPRETGLILRCAGNAGNPFQTTQGNRLSCRLQTHCVTSRHITSPGSFLMGKTTSPRSSPEPRAAPGTQQALDPPTSLQKTLAPARVHAAHSTARGGTKATSSEHSEPARVPTLFPHLETES